MEEFDDDFSDLYADVEMQASSAIRALNGFSKMPPGDAARGENDNGAEGEEDEDGGITKLPLLYNGNLNVILNDDGNNKQKSDDVNYYGSDGKYDDRNIRCGVTNTRKHDGGRRIEEEEDDDGKKCWGIDGKDESLNGGDCVSQRKSLKRRGDEQTAHKVHKMCENGDADVRDSKNGQPNNGGGKLASERSSRHTHAHASDPVPSDLEKYGSVQISDSVEANDHEGSLSDSDGMPEVMETSGGTNRRTTISMINRARQSSAVNDHEGSQSDSDRMPEVMETSGGTNRRNTISMMKRARESLAVESDSSQSGWSRHGRGSSCSPSISAALSDKDSEKSHEHSRSPSSSSDHEFQGAVSHEYHPSKDSKSHGIRPSSRDGRYFERQRGHTRKEFFHHKRSTDMPDLKTHRTDDIASHAIDNKRLYNRRVHHGNQQENLNLDPNRESKVHFNQSENLWSRSGRFSPDYHLGIRPSFRYKADWRRVNTSERQWEKRSNKMDCETLEDDWYCNQRRQKLTWKYPSDIDRRGTQFSTEGNGVHFRRKPQVDYLSPVYDYIKEKNTRSIPGDRDQDQHRYGRSIIRDRREMEISGRGKRRHYSPLNSSDNLRNIETEDNDRRHVKHRPHPFYSYEEPCAPGRGQSGVPERNTRCVWKDMHIESDRYGTNFTTFDTCDGLRYSHSENHEVRRRHYLQSTNTYVTNNGIIKGHHDQDCSVRIRYHQQPEVSHLGEEVYNSRQQNDTMLHPEGPSYQFERKFSRNNRHGGRHAVGRVAEPIDERKVDRHRIRMIREDHSNQFDGCRKFIQPDSRVQMHPRNRDIVDPHLVVVSKKCNLQSSKRTSEAGDDIHFARDGLMEWNDNQKPINFEELCTLNREKAILTNEGNVDTQLDDKNQHDEFFRNQQNEFLDVEEGQIISEEIGRDPFKRVIASEETQVVESLSDHKIQEIMAKMERRRERFKEPIFSNEKTSNHLHDLDVESAAGKLERPARKRRWLGI